MVLARLAIHVKKNVMASLFHTMHKNYFLWNKDLNMKIENETYRKYLANIFMISGHWKILKARY